ncbi:MAG: hypothetical protein ACRCR1_05005, partial [Aeromonas sp.]
MHAIAALHTYQAQLLCNMREERVDSVLSELRAVFNLALRLMKGTTRALGQVMSTSVVQERFLWLSTIEMEDDDRRRVLDQ